MKELMKNLRVDADHRKWWDASSKGGENYTGHWYKSDLSRPDVGFKKVTDDVKPEIKKTRTEKDFEELNLTDPNLIDWYSHEPYLIKALKSDNPITRREAKIKLDKIEYYRNLKI